jgi:DNA polymerase-3 subunit gamma/tau
MAQALYLKWRPHLWDEVVGQPHIVQTLRNAVAAQRVAHAYLFAGPRGTGKTTTARLLAKAVNCLEKDLASRPCDQCAHCQAVNQGRFLDLIEIDAASNTSVDDVRSLREKINFTPNQGRFKVYIIDEVHMLSTAAFNALLKTLEEPPPHAIFVLATTEIHKIPATVLSRCQRHEFRRISVNEMVAQLKAIAASENLQVDDQALTLLARQATGALRDAISLLDQLASTGGPITLEFAQSVLGTATSQMVLHIVDAIQSGQSADGLDYIHKTLDAGSDPRQFARQIVDYLRGLLLVRMGSPEQVDATAEIKAQMARHAQAFDIPALLRLVRLFNQAANDARLSWQPSLPLEMAFIESIEPGSQGEVEPVKPAPKSKAAPPSRPAPAKAGGAPAAEPPVENAAGEAPDESGLTLKLVSESWRQVLALIRRSNTTTEALLRSGRLLGVKNGKVYLGFSEVLKSKMEKPENLELVRAALKQVFEMDVPVQCVVSAGKAGTLPPDIDSEGMVATALRDLGGEIVDVQ